MFDTLGSTNSVPWSVVVQGRRLSLGRCRRAGGARRRQHLHHVSVVARDAEAAVRSEQEQAIAYERYRLVPEGTSDIVALHSPTGPGMDLARPRTTTRLDRRATAIRGCCVGAPDDATSWRGA